MTDCTACAQSRRARFGAFPRCVSCTRGRARQSAVSVPDSALPSVNAGAGAPVVDPRQKTVAARSRSGVRRASSAADAFLVRRSVQSRTAAITNSQHAKKHAPKQNSLNKTQNLCGSTFSPHTMPRPSLLAPRFIAFVSVLVFSRGRAVLPLLGSCPAQHLSGPLSQQACRRLLLHPIVSAGRVQSFGMHAVRENCRRIETPE